MSAWLIVSLIGLGTLALRFSFIGLGSDTALPEVIKRGLRFVPPAVFTALVTPGVFRPEQVIDVGLGNPRWLAALAALAVAWRTRNIGLTMAAGLVALWILQAVL